jgi:hypothetical protein
MSSMVFEISPAARAITVGADGDAIDFGIEGDRNAGRGLNIGGVFRRLGGGDEGTLSVDG